MSSGSQLLSGRTALVTGASRGLGRAMAIALAREGVNLVLTARSQVALAEVRREAESHGSQVFSMALELDQSADGIAEFADRAWRESGGIDVLFNNAGVTFYRSCLATTAQEWSRLLSINLSAVFFMCQSFGRRMLERGRGKIINVASDLGIRGEVNWSAYSASKGAVVALSKSLAWEWAPKVSVNVIARGPFFTDANRAMFDAPDIRSAVEERVPLNMIGDPERHLGPAAVLLAGPGSDFMTGAVIRIDGGICRS